jgi:hypothetical protein
MSRPAKTRADRLETELERLLEELRGHVDVLARGEPCGVEVAELNREQTEIRRLRTRIAELVKSRSTQSR